MNIKERIIKLYEKNLKDPFTNSQKAKLLFNIILKLIITNKWTYFPKGKGQSPKFMLNSHHTQNMQANCFELTDIFIFLCKEVGIRDASKVIYENKPTSKIGQQLGEYTFRCFDKKFKSIDDQICFDKHCVAKINEEIYDLVFSCTYNQFEAPYDVGAFAEVIHFLAAKNELEALRVLQTSHEIDLDQFFDGESLLHKAAGSDFITISSFLLAKGVDANKPSKCNPPIIPLAYVKNVNSELFTLLSTYTDPLVVQDIKQNKQFDEAVDCILNGKSIEEFSRAIQGADINFKKEGGWTILHHAASANNLSITDFLLKKGANTNIINKEGLIPLQLFINPAIFTLLSTYTDPLIVEEIKQKNSRQCFENATTCIRSGTSIKEFSAAMQDIEINIKDAMGWTMLHHAANTGNLTIATFLLKKGASVNIGDKQGFIPLLYAGKVHSPMYRLLSQKKQKEKLISEISLIETSRYLPDYTPSSDESARMLMNKSCALNSKVDDNQAQGVGKVLFRAPTFTFASLIKKTAAPQSSSSFIAVSTPSAFKTQQLFKDASIKQFDEKKASDFVNKTDEPQQIRTAFKPTPNVASASDLTFWSARKKTIQQQAFKKQAQPLPEPQAQSQANP